MGMSLIVKKVTQFVIGLIFLFGIYITLYGHLTPGGGFPGGIILACGLILIMLAFGKETALKKMSASLANSMKSLGALAFLVIGLLGCLGGYFFLNFLDKGSVFHFKSGGVIIFSNITIMIVIVSSIFILFYSLVQFGKIVKEALEEEED